MKLLQYDNDSTFYLSSVVHNDYCLPHHNLKVFLEYFLCKKQTGKFRRQKFLWLSIFFILWHLFFFTKMSNKHLRGVRGCRFPPEVRCWTCLWWPDCESDRSVCCSSLRLRALHTHLPTCWEHNIQYQYNEEYIFCFILSKKDYRVSQEALEL